MKILALESSGLVASVAVVTEDKMIGEFTTNFKKTHSQTLLPMMDQLLKTIGVDIKEIDAIAVSGGPGSFTGLRIGAATAKGLGQALNLPVIGVPTVDAIAYNLFGVTDVICPLMDARRQQVYTGLYSFEGQDMKTLSPADALPCKDILEKINAMGRPVVFLGDGVPVFTKMIEETVTVPYSFAPVHACVQRAGTLGALGLIYYKDGKYTNAADHAPDYLRVSQAERERAEKLAEALEGKQSEKQEQMPEGKLSEKQEQMPEGKQV